MSLEFEWNDRKARTNLQKHGVDFVEATLVSRDPLARIFVDEGHSTDELREIIIGHSKEALVGVFHGAREGAGSRHQRAERQEEREARL
jgi:uncharacterized DUF497 family protein